jgi:hypothetical protein
MGYRIDHLGDWSVLCHECAKHYRTQIVTKEVSPNAGNQRRPVRAVRCIDLLGAFRLCVHKRKHCKTSNPPTHSLTDNHPWNTKRIHKHAEASRKKSRP